MTALVPVVIRHALPAEIPALSVEAQEKAALLVANAATALTDPSSYTAVNLEAANAIYRDTDALKKGIEKQRLDLTRPIDDLKKAIIEAERTATLPLEEARQALGKRIVACESELRRQREAEERKRREEAERIAAEQRRIADEERKAALAKWEAEMKAAEEAEAERKAMFGDDDDAETTVVVPPPPAPVRPIVPVVEAAPAAPLPKSAVRTQVRKVLCIVSRAELLAAACKDCGNLYGRQVLTIDEAAVEALLKAGVAVPGARLDEVEGIASNRGGR